MWRFSSVMQSLQCPRLTLQWPALTPQRPKLTLPPLRLALQPFKLALHSRPGALRTCQLTLQWRRRTMHGRRLGRECASTRARLVPKFLSLSRYGGHGWEGGSRGWTHFQSHPRGEGVWISACQRKAAGLQSVHAALVLDAQAANPRLNLVVRRRYAHHDNDNSSNPAVSRRGSRKSRGGAPSNRQRRRAEGATMANDCSRPIRQRRQEAVSLQGRRM